jgi:two-component system, cell cycle response regulator DivK
MLTVLTQPSSILVVDANPLSRQLICQLLQRAGHTVIIAADGLAALTAARQAKPDAVVIDLNLPGVPGLEAVRWLRAQNDTAHIPVLGLSAFSGSEHAARFIAAGCSRFFAKPVVSAQAFLAAIAGMLRREPDTAVVAQRNNVVQLRRAS